MRQLRIHFVLATVFISSGCWSDRPVRPTQSSGASSLNSASADCGQGSGRQFDNMAPCCGQGYSTTPVACYSTVFHVFHDSDRIGTYCHGSGALDSASACATKGQVHNVIRLWSGCRATQPSRRPLRAAEGTSEQGALGLRGFKLKLRAERTNFDLVAQYGAGPPEEVALPDFSGPWQLETSLTLAPRAEAISESERPACC